MNELQRQFFAEAEEVLESLFSALQQLRRRRGEGRVRRDLTGQIFRLVHTLKGLAGTAGMESIKLMAHEFETVLDGVRLGRIAIDDALLDAFEDAAYAISENLAGAEAPAVAADLVQRLERFAALARETDPPLLNDLRSFLPSEIAGALSRYDEQRLREATSEGACLFLLAAEFSLALFDQEFRDLSTSLALNGEILATVPGGPALAAGGINFRILYATTSQAAEIKAQLGNHVNVTVTELKSEQASGGVSLPARGGATREATPLPVADTVRVRLTELDDLIALTSALSRDTADTLELSDANRDSGPTSTAADSQAVRIQQQFVELENRLIKLRLVPLAAIFERASRTGRLTARARGKEVAFAVSGGEVSIDKSLAVAIAEPLMHLVRNAVDHGIEFPEQRVAAGKDAAGLIRLSAVSASNRVQIYVADDGCGIDPARVARAAAEREIVADPARVTFDQCLRLIFRPGFSTATEVSDTSGRGIGLEIVDQAMAETGGEVRVRTEPGRGTTFQMILPAALAQVSTIMVQAGKNRYHIDARCVVESGPLDAAQIETSRPKEGLRRRTINWRGKAVPLHDLRDLLDHTNGEIDLSGRAAKPGSFLIIRNAGAPNHSSVAETNRPTAEHIALLVDNIEGEQQALVRSLGRYATRWRGVAGANELRDGSVALVLDLPQLLEAANQGGPP